MRITGGDLRGRVLRAPEGIDTRPTSDRVREALFNILTHREWRENIRNPLIGATVLDAFAGTGALGIEAISRGAAQSLFFEKERRALASLRQNIAFLGLEKQTRTLPVDVTKPPKAEQAASLVFLDPPYHKGLIETAVTSLAEQDWIAPHALLVCETARGEELNLPDTYPQLLVRTYGDTSILFYKSP